MDIEIDYKLLSYWVAGLALIMVLAYGIGVYTFGQDGLYSEDSDYVIVPEDEELETNELSRVQIIRGDSNISDAEIFIGDVYIGDTNSEGRISYRAPSQNFNITASIDENEVKHEIKVIDGGTQPIDDTDSSQEQGEDDSQESSEGTPENETEQSQEDIEEIPTGIILESNPIALETNRLTAYSNDGERLSSEEVTINEEYVGNTTPGGSISFEVPNAEKMIITVSDITQEFQVEEHTEETEPISGNINPQFEMQGMPYAGETLILNATVSESKNPVNEYEWHIEAEDFTEERQGEIVEYDLPSEGSYYITLTVTDSEGFSSNRTQFTGVGSEYAGPTIYLNQPRNEEVVKAERDFHFQVENARSGQEANIHVGSRKEASTVLSPNLNVFEDESAVTVPIHEEGVVEYWIEVKDEGASWNSSKRQINNLRSYGEFGNFTVSPADGYESSGETEFEFELNLEEPVELQLSGTSEENTFGNQTNLPSSTENYLYSESIPSGEYSWSASISPIGTTETEQTEQRQLTIN